MFIDENSPRADLDAALLMTDLIAVADETDAALYSRIQAWVEAGDECAS